MSGGKEMTARFSRKDAGHCGLRAAYYVRYLVLCSSRRFQCPDFGRTLFSGDSRTSPGVKNDRPVHNIALPRTPLQIGNSVVGGISVDVVYEWQVVRVRKKNLSDQSVNRITSNKALFFNENLNKHVPARGFASKRGDTRSSHSAQRRYTVPTIGGARFPNFLHKKRVA